MTNQASTASDPRRPDVDRDRGVLAGALTALGMTFLLQAMIAGAYQLASRGAGPMLGPTRYAGFTQLIYIAPTTLLFINRRCPKMAAGVGIVASSVLLINVIVLLFG